MKHCTKFAIQNITICWFYLICLTEAAHQYHSITILNKRNILFKIWSNIHKFDTTFINETHSNPL